MSPMTDMPVDETPFERLIEFAPSHLAIELRQLATFIDAPASAQAIQRVVRNLECLGSDLEHVAKLSGSDMILRPSNFASSLKWILSEAAAQTFAKLGIDSVGGNAPPRGTLTANPIFAALWLRLSADQMRVRDALLQVMVAHAMLPALGPAAKQYHSAREKAGRAIRELAKLNPRELLSRLPSQNVSSGTAYAAELKLIIDFSGDVTTSTDLGSIRHLIETANGQRDVRLRGSGGQHQTGQRVSRPQGEGSEVSGGETYSIEDVGAAVTVVTSLPTAEIAADLENSGSISSEIEPRSEIFIVRFEDEPGAERSAMQNRLRVQAVAKGIARSNQKLVGQVTALSPLEIEVLIEEILRACSAKGAAPAAVKSAVLVCCALATGRSFEDLAVIVDGAAGGQKGTLTLEEQEGRYFFKAPALALQGAQDLTAQGQDQAVKTGSSVRLPIPEVVQRLLAKVLQGGAGANTNVGAATLIIGAQDFLAKASKARSARFTERRVEGWLFQQILNLDGGGIAAAALITATTDPLATNPAQYLTLSSGEVIDLYLRAVKPLNRLEPVVTTENAGLPFKSDFAIGSRYLPRQEVLAAFIAKMQDELAALKTVGGNFAAIHNAFIRYTVMMSAFSCGFRTVREPILRPSEIDETTGFAVLQDKDSQDGYNARLIWVPLTMRTQLQFYSTHLRNIREAIRFTDPVRYQQMELPPSGQPSIGTALFLLDEDGISRVATVVALKESFAHAGWHLPLNAGRHYLQTCLRRHCSNDTMLAFLGHWSRGTEPWSSASAFDPEMYRADIGPALTKLIDEDGWTPISGFQP